MLRNLITVCSLSAKQSDFQKINSRLCLVRLYSDRLKGSLSSNNSGISLEGETLILSPAMAKKKEMLKIEMNMQKMSGNYFIPKEIKDTHWAQLLQMNSINQRKKFYKYLKNKEISKIKKQRNQQKRLEDKLKSKQFPKDHLQYGLGKNFIIPSISQKSMVEFYNSNLIHALLFGQDLVIDLDFFPYMSPIEQRHCFGQLLMLHSANRKDKDPFHLHFCNVDRNHELFKRLQASVPVLQKEDSLMGISEKNYLDLFPKNKLVYLTPYAEEALEYNHNDVYIIGGFVQRGYSIPRTLAKVKKDGIRCAKLPFKQYIRWKPGRRELPLNLTMKILLTVKNTMDWTKAFKYIPSHLIEHSLPNDFSKLQID